jgi:pimeloyl-ACP methyl ester carboxylesterase
MTGKGRLILLLHGWGDSSNGVKDLQKRLSASYTVLTPDLPGFGATQPPHAAWDLDDYSKFIEDLLTKLDQAQPYAVIGHSNGGAMAIRAISLGRLSPKKLVLMASAGVRTNSNFRRFILKIVAKTGNLATIWMPERYRRALRKTLYGVAGSDMMVAPHIEDTFRKTVRQDVQADAASIKVSTLLIYAANDDAIPIADGRQYNKLIRNSKLEIIQDAGHFVHIDQPEKTTKLIEEFLA